jgi:uncharacterized protein Yka (UPF0111/DUF47 family)
MCHGIQAVSPGKRLRQHLQSRQQSCKLLCVKFAAHFGDDVDLDSHVGAGLINSLRLDRDVERL